MSSTSPDTVMVACSVLKAEVEKLRKLYWQDLPLRFLSSMLHMKPELLEQRLSELITEEASQGHQVLLVYGDCCAGMADMESLPGVARTPCYNCCGLLLGRDEYRRLEHEGAFFLIPEWASRWWEIFDRELGLNHDNAHDLMQEMHSRLVYLNTGIVPVPVEDLKACAEYVGLPFEIMPIELDNMTAAISTAFEQLRTMEKYHG